MVFKLILTLLIISLTFVIIHYRTRYLQRQRKILKLKVAEQTEELTVKNLELEERQEEILRQVEVLANQKQRIEEISAKLHEADQAKLIFYTNISHELRTPLTLILGPVQKILSEVHANEHMVKSLNMVYSNAQKLLKLVNQLLDIRKIEKNQYAIKVTSADIKEFLADIIKAFQGYAEKKQINIAYLAPDYPIISWFDQDALEKIFTNLISNALKFTPKEAFITISLSKVRTENKEEIELRVQNEGEPISDELVPHLFDRFYSGRTLSEKNKQGSGIGLSLTKDLVEAHHGRIYLSKNRPDGIEFTVMIPSLKQDYQTNEIIEGTSVEPYSFEIPEYFVENDIEPGATLISEQKPDDQKDTILIVEDNQEINSFIKQQLETDFNILETFNGSEGWESCQKNSPDLVISDIIMPEMDGIELCRNIKKSPDTSHIPVILLTAKSEIESRISGYEEGADDYITKPFNILVLRARIDNILNSRRKLKKLYSSDITIEDKVTATSSLDREFMEKLASVIHSNMANPSFSAEMLAKEMGYSKTKLYRKIKALTGLSINLYIRRLKLQKVVELLKDPDMNITEICYTSGFSSASYLTQCFSEQFGMSPSEYRKNPPAL